MRGRSVLGERGAVRVRRARFRRQHERGSELRGDGAGAQNGRDRVPVGDAARSDQVDRVPARDEPEQREQSDVLGIGLVQEAPPVTAALGALHHEGIRPGRARPRGPPRGR